MISTSQKFNFIINISTKKSLLIKWRVVSPFVPCVHNMKIIFKQLPHSMLRYTMLDWMVLNHGHSRRYRRYRHIHTLIVSVYLAVCFTFLLSTCLTHGKNQSYATCAPLVMAMKYRLRHVVEAVPQQH